MGLQGFWNHISRPLTGFGLVLGLLAPIQAADISGIYDEDLGMSTKTTVSATGQTVIHYWGAFPIVDMHKGQPILDTPVGRVRVNTAMLEQGQKALDILTGLVDQGSAAKAPSPEKPWVFRPSVTVGPYLSSKEALILPEDVLIKQDTDSSNNKKLAATIQKAVTSVQALPEVAKLRPVARQSLFETLEVLHRPDTTMTSDDVNPGFGRRVIADGWLTTIIGETDAGTTLKEAVIKGRTFRPTLHYKGETQEVIIARNAFDAVLRVLDMGDRIRLSVPVPEPMFHWPLQKEGGWSEALVVVDVPGDADVLANPAQALAQASAAVLYHKDVELARWSADEGFIVEEKRWREVVKERGGGLDKDIVSNYMPPHIPLTDPLGTIAGIIVPNGMLFPAKDGSPEEGQRFIKDAAKLLPDAAYLDLITQYLFKYVYDSPDPGIPVLMGSQKLRGDIHQTAEQTLATSVGGVCRGDCDDLSEIIQAIVREQGGIPYTISLPAHAAAAWAEQKDGKWHTYIMQTGPTMEFIDKELPESLRKAYTSFDASETFDPNGLGLLLRFSGENTRSAWRLSYRIFAEKDYADAMIAVQKDWHYQTYLQGINTMLQMIADGDEDTANYRELSGLYSFTGQYAKAAEYHAESMERTPDIDGKVLMALELIQHQLDAGDEAAAMATVDDLIDSKIPAAKDRLGQSMIQVALELTQTLIGRGQAKRAAEILVLYGKDLIDVNKKVAAWSSKQFDEDRWHTSTSMMTIGRMTASHAAAVIGILREIGLEATDIKGFQAHIDAAQSWITHVAMNDHREPAMFLWRMGQIGAFHEAIHGEKFMSMIEEAELPESLPVNPQNRASPLSQLGKDAPYVKLSLSFWNGRLGRMIGRWSDPFEQKEAERLSQRIKEVIAQIRKLNLVDAQLENQIHRAEIRVALITQDAEALRELFKRETELDDKARRDSTTGTLGTMARYLEPEWFREVIEIWREEVDYKPKYLWIAWRAALNKAPEQALYVAKIAAERFPEDSDFQEEYAFMQELFKE